MKHWSLKSLATPTLIVATLVIVANVAVFAAWTAPRWSTRLGVGNSAVSIDEARRRVEPAVAVARDTYGRVDTARADLATLREELVTTTGGAELLGLLDGAGDDVGIDLDDATLQYAPINELGVVQLGITFPVSGTYSAVRQLLDELVMLPVFLVIDGIGLQSFSGNAGAVGATEPVRVDLAVSVFFEDPDFSGEPATTAVARRPLVDPQRIADLRQAAAGEDADEMVEAILATLAAMPPLPVDADALVVDLARLDAPMPSTSAQRNLFAIVLPPEPPPAEIDTAPAPVFVAPEPELPVRLIGVVVINGERHASLTDDVQVFVVAAGDRLANGVEIAEVGEDSVTLIFRDERTLLQLEGTRP